MVDIPNSPVQNFSGNSFSSLELKGTSPDIQMLLKIAVLCNNAVSKDDHNIIGQPTETAMIVLAKKFRQDNQRNVYI